MAGYLSAVIRDKDDFLKDSMVTIDLKGVEGIQLVSGKLKGEGKGGPLRAKIYRFDKKKFTEKQAGEWLKKHKVKYSVIESEGKEEAMDAFEDVWNKVTGPQVTEQKVRAMSNGDGYMFKGSYEELMGRIRGELQKDKKYGEYPSVMATFPKKVFVEAWFPGKEKGKPDERKYFEVEYEIDGEEIKLGKSVELEKKTELLIKEWATQIACSLYKLEEVALSEATWKSDYINDLPDSSFAYVESGDKDDKGKTTPRSKRHYPLKDEDGKWDRAHVINALVRFRQATKKASPWMTEAAKKKVLSTIKAGYKALEMDFPEEE